MLIKDLPKKREPTPIYKVQSFGDLIGCWHEFSRPYTNKQNAIKEATRLKRGRVIERFNGKESTIYET